MTSMLSNKVNLNRPSLIWFLLGCSLLTCATGCQGEAADTNLPEQASGTVRYIYRGETLVEGDPGLGKESSNPVLDRLFYKQPPLSRLTRTSDPNTVYLFDTIKEAQALGNTWLPARPGVLPTVSDAHADAPASVALGLAPFSYDVPTFLACNEFLLAFPCLDIFKDGLLNLGTGQFELRDLRELRLHDLDGSSTNVGSLFNDQISSLGGGYNPADARQGPFFVQIFQDPNRGGASWTIVVDAWRPTFYDGNIHDNRMNSRHSWGDQISSIYASDPRR